MKQRWFTLMLVVAVVAGAVSVGPVGVVRAMPTGNGVPILYYDFENNTTRTTFENLVEQAVNSGSGPLTKVGGAGSQLTITGVSGAGTFNSGSANGQALSTSGGGWDPATTDPGITAGHYYQFTVNTTGFSQITIAFDNLTSNTGPANAGVLYSTDGTTFFPSTVALNGRGPTWSASTFDLSSASAIDNQTSVTFRIYAYAGSASDRTAGGWSAFGSGGTFRIDNLTVFARTATASRTLLDYPAIGLSLRSGTSFTPTYTDFTASGAGTTVTSPSSLNLSGGLTVNSGAIFAASATLTVNGPVALNGSFQLNQGGWATGSGTWTYGSSGTLIFNNTTGSYGVNSDHVYWPTINGPVNVNVLGLGGITMNTPRTVSGLVQTSATVNNAGANRLTLNGTTQINGGWFADTPIYGTSSTLIYNPSASYNVSNEWPNSNGPTNVTIQNNTAVILPNGAGARTVPGNFTIASGSLTLGGNFGDDLDVGGNWTNSGTFTPNNRAVFFNGSAPQQLAGATTFDYLTLNNASGLTLNSNVAVNQTLDLANGDISTGSNVLTLGGSVTGSGDVVGTARRTSLAANTAYAFSNARTQLTFVSPLSIPQMDVTLAKSTSPSFVYALPRRYTLSEPGVAFSAIVQLAYKPAEIPGGTVENNIRLWRYDTGASAWENRGGTVLTFVSPWGAVSQTGITQFSDWVLSGVTPTSVTLTGLDAQPQSNDLWLGAGLLLGVVLLLIGWQMQRRRA
jgi:hypothetical protein